MFQRQISFLVTLSSFLVLSKELLVNRYMLRVY
jgi:hypothetical protein